MPENNLTARNRMLAEYKERKEAELLSQSREIREYVKEIEDYITGGRIAGNHISQAVDGMRNGAFETPGQYFKSEGEDILAYFVPEEEREGFLHIVDKLNQFPFTWGPYQPAVRTKEYESPHYESFTLLYDYYIFGIYETGLADYLLGRMDEEKLNFKYYPVHFHRMGRLDLRIAARLDAKDEEVVKAVKELLSGGSNTGFVTRDIIRGILKSSNFSMHKLLGDFFLAAGTQEGVRQAVCENMACGTIEGFLHIFGVIWENNLIRFPAVMRTVCGFLFIRDDKNLERVSKKIMKLLKENIYNPENAPALVKSRDTVEVLAGLWILCFYDIGEAVKVMDDCMDNGTKNQRLALAYFIKRLEYKKYPSSLGQKAFERFSDDFELLGAFRSSYMGDVDKAALSIYQANTKGPAAHYMPLSRFFKTEEEGRLHFDILKKIYEAMPKKKLEFSPGIFPWYKVCLSKSSLVKRLCMLAGSLLDEEKRDYAAANLSMIEAAGECGRYIYLDVLLHSPKTPFQQDILVRSVAERDTFTQNQAFQLLEPVEQLNPRHYAILEDFLRYKAGGIRRNVIALLGKQKGQALFDCITGLLKREKEEYRTAALDMLLQLIKKKGEDGVTKKALEEVKKLTKLTEKEKILVDEILKNTAAPAQYRSGAWVEFPDVKADKKSAGEFFNISQTELMALYKKLEGWISANRHRSYTKGDGTECLLGNGLFVTTKKTGIPYEDKFPFKELWRSFYEKEIHSPRLLYKMYFAAYPGLTGLEDQEAYDRWEEKIFGNKLPFVDLTGFLYTPNSQIYGNMLLQVLEILMHIYGDREYLKKIGKDIFYTIMRKSNPGEVWFLAEKNPYSQYSREFRSFLSIEKFRYFIALWEKNFIPGEFSQRFFLLYEVRDFFQRGTDKEDKESYYETEDYLNVLDYIQAYIENLIDKDMVFKGIWEELDLKISLGRFRLIFSDRLNSCQEQELSPYGNGTARDKEGKFYKTALMFYEAVINEIMETELSRGDTPTCFSKVIGSILRIDGLFWTVRLLLALGEDKLVRKMSIRFLDNTDRTSCLCHLLRVCYPKEEDSADKLSQLLKGKAVTENRLIELSLYAPQWTEIVEEYLHYPGLKKGCYYFIAHMDYYFDEETWAVIARYTPLTKEELMEGAFDLQWFTESYEALGSQVFQKLYDGAKYISDGKQHARARKYADAALGRAEAEELEREIGKKRNKDLLMSYGLIPIKNKADLLRRYEFIQNFSKESRQFGAQRRQSEKRAVDMALKNLAVNGGFDDTLRLTLYMEGRLASAYEEYFAWEERGGVYLRLFIDETGQPSILLKKAEKPLKTLPAALKKDAYVCKLREIVKKLKEQYRRTIKIFEEAMEESSLFQWEEIVSLYTNPVTAPIIEKLVFGAELEKGGMVFGFIKEKGLEKINGTLISLKPSSQVFTAHPFLLYKEGILPEYQEYIFKKNKERPWKQPFRQVFREIYTKLPQEYFMEYTLMFAGNPVQQKKMAACLKDRRWIGDYRGGLQKIYYKENIAAVIDTRSGWFFSDSIQDLTIDRVEFYGRKTGKALKIMEVPEIIYSEIMRDVDLGVSIAHSGGVDPETTHSTIEMRRVIAEFNLTLFGLSNVKLEGSHALIQGEIGEYSIHLGSGTVHKIGGTQIQTVPVQRPKRGKLFLPFLDDDPKTAEIISKILLFARDKKIKDPYILQQLY